MMSTRLAGLHSAKVTKSCWPAVHTRAHGVSFLRLKEDVNWADITERNGNVRSHPVIWLAHSASAMALTWRP